MADQNGDAYPREEAASSLERENRVGQQLHLPRTRGMSVESVKGNLGVSGNRTFAVGCEPHDRCSSHIAPCGLSLFVGQCLRRNGHEQMWNSVVVHCAEEEDGTLVVRVLVSNPDWEEPLQIACIRSRPGDTECLTALGCNLDHITESKSVHLVQPPGRPLAARNRHHQA